jgi:hypothetical protein
MWGSILSTSVITVLIMFLLHHTYMHLQATLTVPKVSDLVRRPEKKYAEIDSILQAGGSTNQPTQMKSELNDFLSHLRR